MSAAELGISLLILESEKAISSFRDSLADLLIAKRRLPVFR